MKTTKVYRKTIGLILILLLLVGQSALAQYSILMSNPDDIYWDDRFDSDSLGIVGTVLAMAVGGSDLYVGGIFTKAGNDSINNIAQWDGNSWSMLGSGSSNGVNGLVNAIAVSGSNVYVGGTFTTAGGVSVSNIAKWNGSTWSALGSGTDGDVRAIAVIESDVYVGGFFTMAGGNSANNIAQWDGSSWSVLGGGSSDGVNGVVRAIAGNGSKVYAGGAFTTAGDSSANNIAMWDTLSNTWSTLGSGVSSGDVDALAVSGSDLYVGGNFTNAGGTSAKKIAKWNGSSWSTLGSGITGGDVNTMAFRGIDLYVAGSFDIAGGDSANQIAKWDGSSWSALGSGIDGGLVFALGVYLNDVYVGGSFTTAGGKPSSKFARWQDGVVPIELVSFTAHARGHLIDLHWITATEINNFGFEVERRVIDATSFMTENNSQSRSANNEWEEIAFVKGNGTTTAPQDYSYTDNVETSTRLTARTLLYRLKQIDLDGTFEYYEPIEVTLGVVPNKIILGQNYPNPFNPETTIEFVIPNNNFTTLKVYNTLGQEVRTLINDYLEAGVAYKVRFDASTLPSGLYYYTLRSGNMVETKKMMVIK